MTATGEQNLVKMNRESKELRTIHGVLVKMTDRAVMNRNLRELTGVDPKGMKEPELIERLTEFFAPTKDQCVPCDKCLGLSDPGMTDECPYCGEKDAELDASVILPALEAQLEQAQERKTKKRKEEAAAAQEVDMGALENWRQRMNVARVQTGAGFYNLGKLLMECADSHYWRLERGEDGQLRYRTVVEMFEAEYGIKPTMARQLIGIAREFPQELVDKYNRQFILNLFAKNADTRRELLLAMEAEDLTEQQAKERAEVLEEQKRIERDKARKAKQEALEPKEQLLTLVAKPNKQKVKLFTYADEDKRAKRVNERPVGVLQLERGRIAIEIGVDAQGQLEATIKALPNES